VSLSILFLLISVQPNATLVRASARTLEQDIAQLQTVNAATSTLLFDEDEGAVSAVISILLLEEDEHQVFLPVVVR
jgi:hypothetical protein